MVVSAQLRLGGFYAWVTLRIGALGLSPPMLLGALIFTVAGLSAVFSNDIICLAMAPVLIDVCRERRSIRCPICSPWPARRTSGRPRR